MDESSRRHLLTTAEYENQNRVWSGEPGVGTGAAIAAALKAVVEFDKRLSRLEAIHGLNAS